MARIALRFLVSGFFLLNPPILRWIVSGSDRHRHGTSSQAISGKGERACLFTVRLMVLRITLVSQAVILSIAISIIHMSRLAANQGDDIGCR
jgi:hypothetical protein